MNRSLFSLLAVSVTIATIIFSPGNVCGQEVAAPVGETADVIDKGGIPVTGSVKVLLRPDAAVTAGAKWTFASAERNSGETVTWSTNQNWYSVFFKHVPGWISPPFVRVPVYQDGLIEVEAKYETPSSALSDAVDGVNNVNTLGTAHWSRVAGSIYTAGDCAKSGAIGEGQSSILSFRVTGPGQINYWYKTSCAVGDALQVLRFPDTAAPVTKELIRTHSGIGSGFYGNNVSIPPGVHYVYFQYQKNSDGVVAGSDCAWIDGLQFWRNENPAEHGDLADQGRSGIIMNSVSTNELYMFLPEYDGINRQTCYEGSWGSSWQLLATGDANGDRRADLLMKHVPSGYVYHCRMLVGATGWTVPAAEYWGSSWECLGNPDVNGDGRADILLRHGPSNMLYICTVGEDGYTRKTVHTVEFTSSWNVLGYGDFNGDKRSDLVLKHVPTGTVYFCRMRQDGAGWGVSHTEQWGNSWQLVSTPDLNGDRISDMILKHTPTGTVYYCIIRADGINRDVVFTNTWGTSWRLVGAGDFNGDRREDLVLKHDPTGVAYFIRTRVGGAGGDVTHTQTFGTQWEMLSPKTF